MPRQTAGRPRDNYLVLKKGGLPMTITDRIEMNPKVVMGKPVIRGTRVPVS